MHFASGDSDFRAHAEFPAIRELGRGIAYQNGTVQSLEKPFGRGVVFGQDRIGMLAAKSADMVNRAIDAVNDFGGYNHIQKLVAKIFRFGGDCARDRQQITLGAHFDPVVNQIA